MLYAQSTITVISERFWRGVSKWLGVVRPVNHYGYIRAILKRKKADWKRFNGVWWVNNGTVSRFALHFTDSAHKQTDNLLGRPPTVSPKRQSLSYTEQLPSRHNNNNLNNNKSSGFDFEPIFPDIEYSTLTTWITFCLVSSDNIQQQTSIQLAFQHVKMIKFIICVNCVPWRFYSIQTIWLYRFAYPLPFGGF